MYTYKIFARNKTNNCIEIKKADDCLTISKDTYNKEEKIRGPMLDDNLKIAAKGTGILFFGQIIGAILALISSILIARVYSVGEYGLYGLTIFIVSFFLNYSSLGLSDGCPRFVSYYLGKKDNKKVKGTINSSLIVVSISSTIFAFLLYFLSDFIAIQIFHIKELTIIIKIAVIGLPFSAIISLIIAIFRGFESTKENVYFSNILGNFLKVSFFAFVIYLGLSFNYVMIAYTISAIITCFVAIYYLLKNLPSPIKKEKKPQLQIRFLLSFSWPIIFSGLGFFLITGSDKLMLGILSTEVKLGLYNAALSLAQYLSLFLSITIFIFQPIATRLFAENKMNELKRDYQVLTKWLFALTFPLLIFYLLFPETAISIFFGEKYLAAAKALQLLTIGWWFYLLLGPNGSTVIALGKTKIIMFFTLICGSFNIILNYFLIPLFGIEGAALSTIISLAIINILDGVYLYKISKIQPFRKDLVFHTILSLIIISISYYFIVSFQLENLPLLFKLLICSVLIITYFFIILVSKNYGKEDLQLLILVENKIGFKFNIIRKIIKRFL